MATPQDSSSPPDDTPTDRRNDPSVSLPQMSVNGTVEPGAQAHDLTPTSSTEADKDNTHNPSVTASTFVSPDERDSTRHAEKDKSSLAATSTIQPNTTTTGTSTTASSNTSRRFSRKPKAAKPPASTSAVPDKSPPVRAPSQEANKSKGGSQRSPKKASFISKLVRKLVPCVAPNDRAHVVDIDVLDATRPLPQASTTSKPADPPVPNEKHRSEPDSQEKEHEKVAPPPISIPKDPSPSTSPDVEVIVPPTPTKALLPISETEGVTSGAVQPPGSTGSDIFSAQPTDLPHTSSAPVPPHVGDTSHSTTTDSDGSFTDDEVHGEGEEAEPEEGEPMEEDDEDALILNGGAGIPIGPVGVAPTRCPTSVYLPFRTAFRGHFCPRLHPITRGANVWFWTWTKPSFTAASR
jgi:RNA polymerase II subunit A small phosphatase-like protein